MKYRNKCECIQKILVNLNKCPEKYVEISVVFGKMVT